jgi:two-component system, NarL family, sensor histidine kinase DesK
VLVVDGSDPQRWAQGWRRLVLAAGMFVYPIVAAAGIAQYSRGAAAVAGYVIVVAFAGCYVLAGASGVRLRWGRFWLLIGVMTALFVAMLPLAHENAFFLCAVVVSMAAGASQRYAVPVVTAAVLASLIVPWAVQPWHSGPGWIQAVTIVFTVLTFYAFAEIARANRALVEARADVARLASEAERARIARDLHDLLGHSLTAITVKSGLARRLAPNESDRSRQEITEVEQLSRQALADVRAAVSGYREVTLAGELARGRELLRASGVAADLPTAIGVVDGVHQELFGWVVREGLTNVARHARASRCTVTVSTWAVEVCDDGVGGGVGVIGGSADSGSGLAGLRERVAAAGGSVEAGPLVPHGWRLRVSLDPGNRVSPASSQAGHT